jgi:hypothetical protein
MPFEFRYGAPVGHRHDGAYLFVLSHMRSFSSLLCHVLGSHPEISGYGETQQSYLGRRDLDRLVKAVRAQTGDPALGRYVLDKILHNRHEIAPAIVVRPDVRWMFMLRRPADTITSIVNMAHSLAYTGEFSDPARVADYYVGRVTWMAQFGAQHGQGALYVDAQRLVDDTDAVLAGLARWLALATPLSREYRTFPLTGAPGHGDPSPNIGTGRVVTDAAERHRDYVPVTIPPDALARADAAYAASRAVLARVCTCD